MRRSTRNASAAIAGAAFPPPFHHALSLTDIYTRSLNIRPLILKLPFPQSSQNDLDGLRIRLERNRSFMRTTHNPNPQDLPDDLQEQDLTNANDKINSFIGSLSEQRPGLLVMLLQPPDGIDFRETDVVEDARPICGIVVRIGASVLEESVADEDLERSIIGAFCRRSVPADVAEELLRVTLIRTIVEALSFEEVECADLGIINGNCLPFESPQGSPGPSTRRDKRFISINSSDLTLCPTVFFKSIRDTIQFVGHIERETATTSPLEHNDDPHKECRCWKLYRKEVQSKEIQSKQSNESDSLPAEVFSPTSANEFYQFWILSAKRIKSGFLASAVPHEPSPSVIQFCLGSVDNSLRAVSNSDDHKHSNKDKLQRDSISSTNSRKRKGSTIKDGNDSSQLPRKKEQRKC